MRNESGERRTGYSKFLVERDNALRERADDLLIAIAVLGLVATVADGDADYREVERFTFEFRKRFALSRRQSVRLIGAALKRMQISGQANIVDCACDTLNQHLNVEQKVRLFEGLAEVLIADGKVHQGEEFFLDYLTERLGLLTKLREKYPL